MTRILTEQSSFTVAFCTHRNYVKPVFWFIVGVMIFLCLFGTISTFEVGCWLDFAIFDSITYSSSRWIFFAFHITLLSCVILLCLAIFPINFFDPKRVFLTKLLACSTHFFLTFFRLQIKPCYIHVVKMLTSIMAQFTVITMSIFTRGMLGKFFDRFSLLADSASFGYDLFSHNVLSLTKNVLVRAGKAPIALSGSLYYSKIRGGVK